MKLDLLIIAAHPDDAELGCAGTIARLKAAGKKVGIADLTRGELGTRGSAELRDEEAAEAARILGLDARENLRFRDGFFQNDEAHQRALIRVIRKYQPEVVIGGALEDRHPDHGRCAALVRDACFFSGLARIASEEEGQAQLPWRPRQVYYMIQDRHLSPSFVVDVGPFFEQKRAAIAAYGSQFYQPGQEGPVTYISTAAFWHFIEARARVMGHLVGAELGEGFISETPLSPEELAFFL
jgi:bacillithiol biosynthesis deacetylase BshB1